MKLALILDPYGEEKPGGLGRAVFYIAKGIVEAGIGQCAVYVKREPKNPIPFDAEFETRPLDAGRLWLSPGKKLSRRHDVYIFFTPLMPLLFFPKKSVVVAHDFAYLELPANSLKEKLGRIILKVLHRISMMKATAVVAVSESAKGSVVRHFGIRPEKVRVIYNGFIPLPDARAEIPVPEKFFLFAGVLKERKNVHGVIRAFAGFAQTDQEFSLLIAGKAGSAYAERMEQLADDLGVGGRVRFLGYVTDAELNYLYAKASALLFPSLVEGFGMPVLEAMERGLPVVTSNEGALAEVAGDAALLVDPRDPRDIARAMNRFARDTALREEYIARGRSRAAQFSWEKNAEEFCSLIEDICPTK